MDYPVYIYYEDNNIYRLLPKNYPYRLLGPYTLCLLRSGSLSVDRKLGTANAPIERAHSPVTSQQSPPPHCALTSPFSRTLLFNLRFSPSPSLELSPPWRRRLGERRRHFSRPRPALYRRRAHPPGMPAPSLSFCCARRSTPNPNKTICFRI